MVKRLGWAFLGVGVLLYCSGLAILYEFEAHFFQESGFHTFAWFSELAGPVFIWCGGMLAATAWSWKARIFAAFVGWSIALLLVTAWTHEIYILAPNVHGWSWGFMLIPVLSCVLGTAWFFMAIWHVVRNRDRSAAAAR